MWGKQKQAQRPFMFCDSLEFTAADKQLMDVMKNSGLSTKLEKVLDNFMVATWMTQGLTDEARKGWITARNKLTGVLFTDYSDKKPEKDEAQQETSFWSGLKE